MTLACSSWLRLDLVEPSNSMAVIRILSFLLLFQTFYCLCVIFINRVRFTNCCRRVNVILG